MHTVKVKKVSRALSVQVNYLGLMHPCHVKHRINMPLFSRDVMFPYLFIIDFFPLSSKTYINTKWSICCLFHLL